MHVCIRVRVHTHAHTLICSQTFCGCQQPCSLVPRVPGIPDQAHCASDGNPPMQFMKLKINCHLHWLILPENVWPLEVGGLRQLLWTKVALKHILGLNAVQLTEPRAAVLGSRAGFPRLPCADESPADSGGPWRCALGARPQGVWPEDHPLYGQGSEALVFRLQVTTHLWKWVKAGINKRKWNGIAWKLSVCAAYRKQTCSLRKLSL